VELREKLDLRSGMAVQRLIIEANAAGRGLGAAELTGILSEGYLLFGVEAWSFVGDQGMPLPVTQETIRSVLLADFSIAAPVAEAADGLYMGPVILPLVNRAKNSSPSTLTNGSTSPRPRGTPKNPKRSKRSSTTTTLTDVTEETSPLPVGASSSSRS
jgi:hypothetical protein